jgi:thioredoxin-related protein
MRTIGRLASLALLFASALALAQADAPKRDPMRHFFAPSLGDLQAEAQEARNAGKRAILVMFMWDDCPYCERMKANVLSLPAVQEHYRRQFAVLAVDTRGAIALTDFAGRQLTEREFTRAQGIKVTPTMVFYDFDGKPLVRFAGEIRDADEFMLLGDFVASGAYRTRSVAEFKQSAASRKGS